MTPARKKPKKTTKKKAAGASRKKASSKSASARARTGKGKKTSAAKKKPAAKVSSKKKKASRASDRLRVLVVGNSRKEGVRDTVRHLQPWLKRRADVVGVVFDESEDLSGFEADLGIIFGGDGSILSTVRRLGGNPLPILGVNFGKLGFLTELSHPGIRSDLERALRGQFDVKELMRLEFEIRSGRRVTGRGLAVNEVSLVRHGTRMITLDLEYNGEPVTEYHADGLIISTPVGSTAYSMAAGGPILHSSMEAIAVTPICPHTLNLRPLVLSSTGEVTVRVTEAEEGVNVINDGQEVVVASKGDEIRVRSGSRFRLAHMGKRTYFETLSGKLFWGARGTAGGTAS